MAVACPSCQQEIAIRDPRAGRYKIRCPHCQARALLMISEGEAGLARIEISPLADEPATLPPSTALTTAPLPEPPARSRVAEPTITLPGIDRFPIRIDGVKLAGPATLDAVGPHCAGPSMWLGRTVQVRFLRPDRAQSPTEVTQFVREAFIAAQLDHPGLVEINGFGERRGLPYVLTEFVDGPTLADRVATQGGLPPELAAAYTLQAARVLKLIHDQNLTHGCVAPHFLQVDAQERLKLSGLGLLTAPRATGPSYRGPRPAEPASSTVAASVAPAIDRFPALASNLAPEQVSDTPSADFRSDLFGLGRTLETLITGRPRFEARTIEEIREQASNAQSKSTSDPRIPEPLRPIINRLTEPRREDRYPTMSEAIAALEAYLGVRSSSPLVARGEDVEKLAASVARFEDGPLARFRPWVEPIFAAVCGVFVLLALASGSLGLAVSVFGLWASFSLVSFVLRGLLHGTPVFAKLREWFALSRPADWATIAVTTLIVFAVLVAFQWIFPAVLLLLLGGGLAAGLHYGVDQPLAEQRNEPLDQAEALLRDLRRSGVSEQSLRHFVCANAGSNWEEFYENLFGYKAKREARDLWGHDARGKRRPHSAPWRDPLHDRLSALVDRREALNNRARLQPIEEAGFLAEGMNLVTARRRSWKTSDAMVLMAAELRRSAAHARRDPDAIGVKPRPIQDVLREAVEKPDNVLQHVDTTDRGPGLLSQLIEVVFGPRSRFLAGTALVALCLIWAHQNAIFSADEIREKVGKAIESQDINVATDVSIDYAKVNTRPLALTGIPSSLLNVFNSWGPDVAGLILIASSLFGGVRIAAFAIPGAALALLGRQLPIPRIGPLDGPSAAMAIGAGLLVLGMVLGRSRR